MKDIEPTYIEAGRFNNTHGIKGELKAEVWLDSPEFLKKFKRVFVGGTEYKLSAVRAQGRFAIIKLEDCDDVNSAMQLKGKEFSVLRSDIRLPKGEFFLQDILGSKVIDESGNEIGVLKEIFETPANNVYVVKGENEYLIPAVPEFILNTDANEKIITVHLIPGM